MPRTPLVAKTSRKQRSVVQVPALPEFRASRPEALLVWRRRLNLTKAAAAVELGVPLDRIERWENGSAAHVPKSRVGKLRPHEICLLMRRRAGLTQIAVADDMHLNRTTLIAMESGEMPSDRLVAYWAFRESAQ